MGSQTPSWKSRRASQDTYSPVRLVTLELAYSFLCGHGENARPQVLPVGKNTESPFYLIQNFDDRTDSLKQATNQMNGAPFVLEH